MALILDHLQKLPPLGPIAKVVLLFQQLCLPGSVLVLQEDERLNL